MLRMILFVFMFAFTTTIAAWEGHAQLTDLVLNGWEQANKGVTKYLNREVKSESLHAFLAATKDKLPAKMQEIELWLVKHEEGYRPVPTNLYYDPSQSACANDIEVCFKKALRINLNVPLDNVVYDPRRQYVNVSHAKPITDENQIMLPQLVTHSMQLHYTSLPWGSSIRIRDVIATASEQPDYGLDVFLYEDNPSSFGKIYGFGRQVIGVATVPFSSQALFHMSTYRESKLILTLMPRLKEDYPEYRAYLYFSLSRFAAETGHAYWAAKFLGWGLHYIQDMTQPYHSSLSMGLPFHTSLYALLKDMAGYHQSLIDLKNIQANRHILLENLTTYLVTQPNQQLKKYYEIINASFSVADNNDYSLKCDMQRQFIRNEMNVRMEGLAPAYSALMENAIPAKYVSDPQFNAESYHDYEQLFLHDMTEANRLEFGNMIAQAFRLLSLYTRSCIKSYGG